MNRREAVQALSAAFVLPALRAMTPGELAATGRAVHARIGNGTREQGFLVLSQHQNAMVTTVAELIIPETDTPGAAAARVNAFIDVMLAEWMDEDDREQFLRGLVALDARSINTFGAPFITIDEPQQVALLKGLDAEVTAIREADLPVDDHFFQRMKWLTLYGYYTSEVGATQELAQILIPGRYDPCGPVRRESSGLWE